MTPMGIGFHPQYPTSIQVGIHLLNNRPSPKLAYAFEQNTVKFLVELKHRQSIMTKQSFMLLGQVVIKVS
ncbi:hypothetical protein D3C77_645950 [compost metagenome]